MLPIVQSDGGYSLRHLYPLYRPSCINRLGGEIATLVGVAETFFYLWGIPQLQPCSCNQGTKNEIYCPAAISTGRVFLFQHLGSTASLTWEDPGLRLVSKAFAHIWELAMA